MLKDYRAGLTGDRADEEYDRHENRRLTVPLFALWLSQVEELFGDPLAI
jgi:haloacetate dehalogenase